MRCGTWHFHEGTSGQDRSGEDAGDGNVLETHPEQLREPWCTTVPNKMEP